LAKYFENSFEVWSQHRSVRFSNEDEVNRGLLAASLAADHAGEQSTWQRYSGLLARYTILSGFEAGDVRRISDGLDELRRAGEKDPVEHSAWRLWRIGPLLPLKAVAEAIDRESWTHASASSNLKLWGVAGDLMDKGPATDAADLCLAMLNDGGHPIWKRTQPTFLVLPAVVAALQGLLPAAGHQAQDGAALFLAELMAAENGFERHEAHRLESAIDWKIVSDEIVAKVFAITPHVTDAHLRCRILSNLATIGNGEAADALVELARGGELMGLAMLDDVGSVGDEAVAAVVPDISARINAIVSAAENGTSGWGRSLDLGSFLVALNVASPSGADWAAVLRMVLSQRVTPEDKAGAIRRIALNIDEVPEDVRRELASGIESVGRHAPDLLTGQSLAAPTRELAHALGLGDDDDFHAWIVGMASSADPAERVASARLMGRYARGELAATLAAMLSDPVDDVREATAEAIGSCFARQPTDSIHRGLVVRAASWSGVVVPAALVLGVLRFAPPDGLDAAGLDAFDQLRSHPSVRVRRRVEWMLAQGEGSSTPGGSD
jgi:HEAT repeat protein